MWRRGAQVRGALVGRNAVMGSASTSLRRAAVAGLPRRAGAETEPEWKLYEEGDPALWNNWKGKAPGALAEQVDIDPNDWHAMTPDYDTSQSLQTALISLGTAIAVLTGAYYFCKAIAPEPDLIPRSDWRTMPPTIKQYQPGAAYTDRPE